ncbi:MAG TPA: hypothetical protein VFB03_01000 [Candidatus Saccharimonadales bacterium]|nr:hypothetical protein [Candidatus Saccharimonadales bacterium]
MTPNKETSGSPPLTAKQVPKQQAKKTALTPKKIRFLLLGILGLIAILFLATAVMGLNKLTLRSQSLVDTKLKNKTVEAQLTSLEGAKKQIDKYAFFNDIAKTVIPDDKDQAQAVLDIFQQANRVGINIESITFPASTLGVSSSLATDSSSAKAAISQAKPVQGISGLYSLELTVTPETGKTVPPDKLVTYAKFIDFLSGIEHDRRTAQITKITADPEGAADKSFTFTLVINIFIRPDK